MGMEHSLSMPEWMPGLHSVEKFISMLQESRKTKDFGYAKSAHMHMCENGLEAHHALGNYLVPMFVECESIPFAQQVFYRLVHRNEHSWTSLIQGYVECGEYQLALKLLPKMQKDCVHPGTHTFAALLKGCARLKDLKRGQQLHAEVAIETLESDSIIGNTLIHLYAKCESLMDARAVFDELPTRNIVSWNALIGGYADHGLGEEVLKCSEQMQAEGLSLDAFTCVSTLKACGILAAIVKGRELHAMIVKQGFEIDTFIGNTLVDMYAKCGSLAEARKMFDKLWVRDLVSWTALIVGYAEQGRGKEAHSCFTQMQLEGLSLDVVLWSAVILGYAEQGKGDEAFVLFAQMQEQCLLPNRVTFLNVLKACSKAASLKFGNRIHAQIHNSDVSEVTEVTIANTLVDMYGKCGSLCGAQQLFDITPTRNIVRWNALITAYARQGDTGQVFRLFERMRDKHLQPDGVTFLSVLTVCCHAGLVGKGLKYFEAMSNEFGIAPSANHYNCMIDLLGRAGQLSEAVVMLKKSSHTDLVGWCILLCACRKWGDVEAGKDAFDFVLSLNKKHAAAFVMMSNIYADAHMWEDAKRIEAMRLKLHTEEKAKSWIEAGGIVCSSMVTDDLYEKLTHIGCKKGGKPIRDFDCVYPDMFDSPQGDAVCGHKEKLTVAFGLSKSPAGTPIRVVQNLLISDVSHENMQVMSEMEQRTIICRDSSCLHVFKDGICSCDTVVASQ